MVFGESIYINTKGFSDIRDITAGISEVVKMSGITNGIVVASVVGSTASVSTIEFEPALVEDMKDLLEQFASRDLQTRHSKTWGDDNGFSHLRATFMGPSVSIPLKAGHLVLGTWQQVVVIDHDNRPRNREIFIQIMGE